MFDLSLEFRCLGRVVRDGLHDVLELVAAHDGHAGVGPHPEETGRVGSSCHSVVSYNLHRTRWIGSDEEQGGGRTSSVRSSYDDGKLGNGARSDGPNHLGTILRDSSLLRVLADHESRDVDEEDEGDTALFAEEDELGGFESRGGEEDAVVGDLQGSSVKAARDVAGVLTIPTGYP